MYSLTQDPLGPLTSLFTGRTVFVPVQFKPVRPRLVSTYFGVFDNTTVEVIHKGDHGRDGSMNLGSDTGEPGRQDRVQRPLFVFSFKLGYCWFEG